jgi:iron complex transport system ATP-binding protein
MDLVAMGRHPYTDWRGQLQKSDLSATEEALRVTGLSKLKEEYLHRLSDGQLQKAMIARALAQDGNLMLLDEPLIHLDIPSKWEIMGLLKQMSQDNGKAIILATHELDLSLKLADRIWLINRKQELLEGTPEELVQNGSISQAFDTEHYQFQTANRPGN